MYYLIYLPFHKYHHHLLCKLLKPSDWSMFDFLIFSKRTARIILLKRARSFHSFAQNPGMASHVRLRSKFTMAQKACDLITSVTTSDLLFLLISFHSHLLDVPQTCQVQSPVEDFYKPCLLRKVCPRVIYMVNSHLLQIVAQMSSLQ